MQLTIGCILLALVGAQALRCNKLTSCDLFKTIQNIDGEVGQVKVTADVVKVQTERLRNDIKSLKFRLDKLSSLDERFSVFFEIFLPEIRQKTDTLEYSLKNVSLQVMKKQLESQHGVHNVESEVSTLNATLVEYQTNFNEMAEKQNKSEIKFSELENKVPFMKKRLDDISEIIATLEKNNVDIRHILSSSVRPEIILQLKRDVEQANNKSAYINNALNAFMNKVKELHKDLVDRSEGVRKEMKKLDFKLNKLKEDQTQHVKKFKSLVDVCAETLEFLYRSGQFQLTVRRQEYPVTEKGPS